MAVPVETAPEAAKAMAALELARANLDGALKLDLKGLDAMPDAGRIATGDGQFWPVARSLQEYRRFQVSARQNEFATLYATVHALSGNVIAGGRSAALALLASTARRNAYKLRQDNAAQAKALAVQMSDLSMAVSGSKDLKQLSEALGQASIAKATLDDTLRIVQRGCALTFNLPRRQRPGCKA